MSGGGAERPYGVWTTWSVFLAPLIFGALTIVEGFGVLTLGSRQIMTQSFALLAKRGGPRPQAAHPVWRAERACGVCGDG